MVNSSLYNKLFEKMKGGNKNKKFGKELLDTIYTKKEFLILVFSNLIAQLGITYFIYEKVSTDVSFSKKIIIFLFLLQLFIIYLIIFIPMPSWLKFILFSIYSALFGVILSTLKSTVNPNIIKLAFSGTMGIFAMMVTFGVALLLFGTKLTSQFGLGLFLILSLLLLFEIISIFAGTFQTYTKIFSFIGLILFSVYIIYDTNTILQRNYNGDFITASMDYYLDILNIFLDLINLNNN